MLQRFRTENSTLPFARQQLYTTHVLDFDVCSCTPPATPLNLVWPAVNLLPHAGTNAQGKIIVSALFLPFSNEIVDAAVADDTKRVPETPSEVTQIAAQLEVAMAVQDQLTSTVQQVAADLQQKVRR